MGPGGPGGGGGGGREGRGPTYGAEKNKYPSKSMISFNVLPAFRKN